MVYDTQFLFDNIKQIKKRINELSISISQFYDGCHQQSTDGIVDLENSVCELSEATDQSLADIENALCELSEG